jgi:hypothetical protein
MITDKIDAYLNESHVLIHAAEIEGTMDDFTSNMDDFMAGMEAEVEDGRFNKNIFKKIDKEYDIIKKAMNNIGETLERL